MADDFPQMLGSALREQGVTPVGRDTQANLWLRVAFEGDVATTQTSFHVKIASDGRYFGSVQNPRAPESLASKITYIAGLDNLSAGPGYDLASGWGSVDMGQFVDAFVSAAALQGGGK